MTTAIYFTSELKMPRNAAGQLNSCRILSHQQATSLATHNECFMRNNGRPMGLQGRLSLAVNGLRGADGNWRVDSGFNQGDVDEIHESMFPGLPMPILVGTTDFGNLMAHLPHEVTSGPNKGKYTDGDAISISLRLAVLASNDPARRYTSADHQVTLRARRKRNDVWWVKVIDPMRPQKDNYQGHWVRESSVRRAAKAINDGVVIAELYPMEGWTAEKLRAQSLRQRIRKLVGDLDDMAQKRDHLRDRRDELNVKLAECRAEISMLTAQLEDCQRDNGADCSDEVKAAYDSAISAIEDLRDEP